MPTMPSRPSSGAVAARLDAAIAPPAGDPIARPEGPADDRRAPSPPRRPRIVVKGAPDRALPARHETVLPLEYPIQPGKVHAPALRDDTLARDRLLDWLSVKVHSRVVLLIAEAGYGKTTLLADFSRRTRVRVLWYRLDRGDRDWVGFIAHLVAAVRVHVPSFGSATAGLLRETATSMPSLETVLDTFLRELSGLPNDPSALVFDDVHLVDDSPDVRQILRELLARGPERMSFVFASRREPPVRLARLRALGEVAELLTDDLRFDSSETERLFRETYELSLEPAVLAELSNRTEGWAASLQLVRAAIHDRNPAQVRAFISSLSGAEGHLYEYLAEEVIGDLPNDLQQFLMRTSVLDTVDLALSPVAAEVTQSAARSFIEEAERHGLFGRGGAGTRHVARAHPLVRQFLLDRLAGVVGDEGIREIHARIGVAAEAEDWRISARHYCAAGRANDARRILVEAIEVILSSGAYSAADDIARCLGGEGIGGAIGLVLASRIAQQRGAAEDGLMLAQLAVAADSDSTAALVNLAAAHALAGNVAGTLDIARLLERSGRAEFEMLGTATLRTMETSLDGSLDTAAIALERLISSLAPEPASHYRGVALLNNALLHIARGDFATARDLASDAVNQLGPGLSVVELVSAQIARAAATAYLGDIDSARREMQAVLKFAPAGQDLELAAEIAEVEALTGEPNRAWPLLERVADIVSGSTEMGEHALLSRVLLLLRDGQIDDARRDLLQFQHGRPMPVIAFEAQRLFAEALTDASSGLRVAVRRAEKAAELAAAQGAWFWESCGKTLAAVADRRNNPSHAITLAAERLPVVISALAEVVLARLHEMTPGAYQAVLGEAERRPWRWRAAVRQSLVRAEGAHLELLAQLLERIGEVEDIPRLREAERGRREGRAPRLSRSLARRLASRVFVEDLGRVQITIGSHTTDGSEIRRKVLALLCLLLSKPKFASTREEVIDRLWPDHDPASALNSLNQTVYFLRRVFEEDFRDEVSPGYVGQDGETIWLDGELIDCRSRTCLEIIRSMPRDPTPDGAIELVTNYRGRFALDFAYEDWSSDYRDSLHAAYLRVIEHSLRLDLDTGHFDRGTFVAERAAEVDPDSEEIQAALVRLYVHSGAHAAAAEQYAHYANALRDLGLEPPALAEV